MAYYVSIDLDDARTRHVLPAEAIDRLVAGFNKRKTRRGLEPLTSADLTLASSVTLVAEGLVTSPYDATPAAAVGHPGDRRPELVHVEEALRATLQRCEDAQPIDLCCVPDVQIRCLPYGGLAGSTVRVQLTADQGAAVLGRLEPDELAQFITRVAVQARESLHSVQARIADRAWRQEQEARERRIRLAERVRDSGLGGGRHVSKTLHDAVLVVMSSTTMAEDERDRFAAAIEAALIAAKEWRELKAEAVEEARAEMARGRPFGMPFPWTR